MNRAVMNKAVLNQWLCEAPAGNRSIFVFYDRLPRTALLWYALRSGKLEIEFDYSRSSASVDEPTRRYIYRLKMNSRLSTEDFYRNWIKEIGHKILNPIQ